MSKRFILINLALYSLLLCMPIDKVMGTQPDMEFCIPYAAYGTWKRVQHGAAYLFKPETAKKADVVSIYPLSDAPKIIKLKNTDKILIQLYLKKMGTDKYAILPHGSSVIFKGKQITNTEELIKSTKKLGYEIGLAINRKTSVTAELPHTPSLINWRGSPKLTAYTDAGTNNENLMRLLSPGLTGNTQQGKIKDIIDRNCFKKSAISLLK